MLPGHHIIIISSVFLQPDSQVRVHWKGAAEIVLANCSHYIDANDNTKKMDEEKV